VPAGFSFAPYSKTMKMKLSINMKSVKPGNEFVSLFSRLTGPGTTGFISHQSPRKEETITLAKDKLSVGNKKTKMVKLCQNHQLCQKQLNCQPGKNHSYQASVDLWFYLSPHS
jgi:hypothetical protein